MRVFPSSHTMTRRGWPMTSAVSEVSRPSDVPASVPDPPTPPEAETSEGDVPPVFPPAEEPPFEGVEAPPLPPLAFVPPAPPETEASLCEVAVPPVFPPAEEPPWDAVVPPAPVPPPWPFDPPDCEPPLPDGVPV